jgi:hypothetical protein
MFAMDEAHTLVIGIANYMYIPGLPPAITKDARDLYELLIDPQHGGYPRRNAQVLLDADANQVAVREALGRLTTRTHAGSTVLIYFAGRAGRLMGGAYAGEYLLPADARYTSDRSLAETSIVGAEFASRLRAIPARNVVVVFDCCHAGGIGPPATTTTINFRAGLPDSYYNALKVGRGRAILASARDTEESWIPPGTGNSLFAQHLLAGLRGSVAGTDGAVGILDLFDYVRDNVTAAYPQQHPIIKIEIEENMPVTRAPRGETPRGTMAGATAGYLRLALVQTGAHWSLLAENIGDRELTAISVTLRPPPSLFVNETLIEIPRLPVAGRSAGKVLTLQTASARSAGERQRADQPVAGSSLRLLERERSRIEGRIEQLLELIDRLQEERDVASGLARMQLDQQIAQQKRTLDQYERELQEIAARAQASAHTSGGTNQPAPQGWDAGRQQPEVVVQLPFSAVYRMAGSPPARVEGVLAVTFAS